MRGSGAGGIVDDVSIGARMPRGRATRQGVAVGQRMRKTSMPSPRNRAGSARAIFADHGWDHGGGWGSLGAWLATLRDVVPANVESDIIAHVQAAGEILIRG